MSAMLKRRNVYLSIKTINWEGKSYAMKVCQDRERLYIQKGDSQWASIGQIRSFILMSSVKHPVSKISGDVT